MRPRVVLLHGASANASAWGPTLAAWDWADVRCPDLPGRGASEGPALASVAALARWLAPRPELDGAIVVGHSLGGGVALQLALDEPGRIAGVVMVSSASRLRVSPMILEAAAMATVDKPMPLEFAFATKTDPAIVRRYAQLCASTPPAAGLADWRACDGFDVRDRVGEVRCPVLVVHGTHDVLTLAKYQVALAQALPDAERVELPGVGHMLPWEDAPALSRAVREWWQRRVLTTV